MSGWILKPIVKLEAVIIDGDAKCTGGTVKANTNNGNKWITLEFRELNGNTSVWFRWMN